MAAREATAALPPAGRQQNEPQNPSLSPPTMAMNPTRSQTQQPHIPPGPNIPIPFSGPRPSTCCFTPWSAILRDARSSVFEARCWEFRSGKTPVRYRHGIRRCPLQVSPFPSLRRVDCSTATGRKRIAPTVARARPMIRFRSDHHFHSGKSVRQCSEKHVDCAHGSMRCRKKARCAWGNFHEDMKGCDEQALERCTSCQS